jgi:hypothetical protein
MIMAASRKLTVDELEIIKKFTENIVYPDRSIIQVVAELREKRPAEEGLDIGEVGMALLLDFGEVELF